MLRAFDDDELGHAKARREPDGRGSVGHPVSAGRDYQYGRQRRSREPGMIETTHMTKSRVSPTDRRPAQSEVGTCRNKIRHAGKPSLVGSEYVSVERGQPLVFPAAAGRERAAHSQRVERRDNDPGPAAMVQPPDRNHRRGQRETLKRTASRAGDAEKHRSAHRMRESDPWTRAYTLENLTH